MKQLFQFSIIIHQSFGCKCFDTAYPCCHTTFRQDLECSDLACIGNMCTTAELNRVISHIYNTDDVAVFLTEQSLCSGLSCFFDRHVLNDNRQRSGNAFIYHIFYFLQFFRCHCREMREIETKSLVVYIRSRLFYMCTKYGTECFLKQMGRTVVSCTKHTSLRINGQSNLISNLHHTLCHITDMTDLATKHLLHIFHNKFTVTAFDHTVVGFLSTACCVERSLIYKDGSSLTVRKSVYDLIFCGKYRNLRFIFQMLVSDKLRSYRRIDGFVYGCICSHVVRCLTCFSCSLALNFHCSFKSLFINIYTFFFQNLFGKIDRESIGII